jgi:drug/metabolite transporter (DMT)-like permease
MAALALSLASSISWGISDFLGGIQSRKMHVLAVVLFTQISGLAFALISLPLVGAGGLSLEQFGIAAAGGAAGAVGLIAFYSGMATGSISVVSPIAGIGVAVPVVVGLGRGEAPTPIQLAGIVIAIAAVVLVSYEETAADEPRASLKPVFLALIAALGFGLFFVGVDATAETDAAMTIVAVRCGGVGVALGAVLAVRPTLARSPGAWKVLLVIGFFDVLANSLFAVASTQGLLSVVSVGGSLYPAVTVLLAYMFIGERLSPIRRGGVLLALAGIVMIAAGS